MTGTIAAIIRHPIKSHGRESMSKVALSPDQGLPWDRHWAVAHEAAKLVPGWNPCANFARGAKAPALMALESQLDAATGTLTLHHPDQGTLTFRPDDPQDLPRFLDWVRPLNPADRAAPTRIVTAGRAMTDTDFASISIFSLASCRDFETRMGSALSPHRWRGNLWVEGVAPFEEFNWVGRRLRINSVELEVVERITRCKATSANPTTGVIDADTLGGLQTHYGHQQFGVYGIVIKGGEIRQNDEFEVL
ncbi:MAG: MOSC domain-containing protein [Paracoccaceae bacterium]